MGVIIFPLIPLFVTSPVAASIFILLLKRDRRRVQPFFWLALISAVPAQPCALPFELSALFIKRDGWSLYFCNNSPGQDTLLLVPTIGTDVRQTYNLKTGRWSMGDALEGYCR